MELIIADWLGVDDQFTAKIGALTTTRSGGVSVGPYSSRAASIGAAPAPAPGGGLNLGLHVDDDPQHVAQNRRRLQVILPSSPVWLAQVHGTVVLDAAAVRQSGAQADASFTTARNVVCAVQTADCLPVLFCDAQARVVAAAHAGWRGLAQGVLERTVARMRDAGAKEILAWMGPAIGAHSFEVGQDVVDAFNKCPQDADAFQMLVDKPGKYVADIYQLARHALQRVGVTRVSGGDYCTVTDPRLYSYRRDKVTGRMASLIWMK